MKGTNQGPNHLLEDHQTEVNVFNESLFICVHIQITYQKYKFDFKPCLNTLAMHFPFVIIELLPVIFHLLCTKAGVKVK